MRNLSPGDASLPLFFCLVHVGRRLERWSRFTGFLAPDASEFKSACLCAVLGQRRFKGQHNTYWSARISFVILLFDFHPILEAWFVLFFYFLYSNIIMYLLCIWRSRLSNQTEISAAVVWWAKTSSSYCPVNILCCCYWALHLFPCV